MCLPELFQVGENIGSSQIEQRSDQFDVLREFTTARDPDPFSRGIWFCQQEI